MNQKLEQVAQGVHGNLTLEKLRQVMEVMPRPRVLVGIACRPEFQKALETIIRNADGAIVIAFGYRPPGGVPVVFDADLIADWQPFFSRANWDLYRRNLK